jgi:hypothetical protein
MLAKMPSAEIRLRKSGGGVFEITVDGNLAYSKRRRADFRQTQKYSAPSPHEPTRFLVPRGARCLPRGGGDLPIGRESAKFASSGDHVSSVRVDLNSAIVAGCRDGRRPAGEIVSSAP